MRHHVTILLVLGLVACSKGDKKEPAATAAKPSESSPKKETSKTPAVDVGAEVGINAGGITHDAKEGSLGAITAVKGTVEVRKLGETKYAAAKDGAAVFAGDVIRTGEAASAQVTLADETLVDVAEVSTIAIASRHGGADPASSAAVLSGIARFAVSPRAPGEGAFRVYTPAGVVLTKGTTYGIGVAASGEARVGVEAGQVEVIGLAALDGKPVEVAAGASVVLAANGDVATPAAWPADDWGTWRDDADAKLEVGAVIDAHAAAMTQLARALEDAYADLSASADGVATFEATAATSASANDAAKYEAALPEGGAQIDASFAVAGRLELLTWAYASHAQLATDLYVRHPAKVEAQWTHTVPAVDAAVLWPKRFEVTAAGYLEPLRMQYYVHHPIGRVHAPFVGVTVPAFYASVSVPAIEPPRVRAHLKTPVWIAPDVQVVATARPVWVVAPAVDWRARVKVAPPPFRGGADFYVRPPSMKAKLFVGVPATASWTSRLAIGAPEPRVNLRAAWSIPVGTKVVIGAPDLAFAARARAGFKANAGVRVAVPAPPRPPDIRGGVKARVEVRAPAVKIKMPEIKGKIGFGVGAGVGAGGGAGARVKAGAGVKVKAPAVKVKVPAVKAKGTVKAKGKIKLGF